MKLTLLLAFLSASLFTGCATSKNNVIAGTGTVLGFELAQNPATSLYQAKLGYARSEVAFVPSTKTDESRPSDDIKSADVIMELHFFNIFQGGGVYQRLAVGENATSQPGAAFMFAKNPDGTLNPEVAKAVSASLQSVPEDNPAADDIKAKLAKAFTAAPNKTVWDAVARRRGFSSFSAFLTATTTVGDVSDMQTELVAAKLYTP